jgi:ankyrin repeat protein
MSSRNPLDLLRDKFSQSIIDSNIDEFKLLLGEMDFLRDNSNFINCACHYNRPQMIKLLLKNGFSTSDLNTNVVIDLVTENNCEILLILLKHNLDYYHIKYIFNIAIIYNNFDIVKYCLINSLIDSKFISCSLQFLCSNRHYIPSIIEMAKLLLNNGAQVDDFSSLLSCQNGHVEIIELFLKHNPDIYIRNGKAFIRACAFGHLKVVKMLLNLGFDVEPVKDKIHGEIAEHFYSFECFEKKNDYLTIIDMIFDYDVDPNSESAMALLRKSCELGFIHIVRIYLRRQVQVKPNNSLLHLACTCGYLEIIKLLIDYGFDMKEANNNGQDLIAYAKKCGHQNVVDFLSSI